MATVTEIGADRRVSIVLTNQEVGLLRSALAGGLSDQHGDFTEWLIRLESDWVEHVDKQGNNNTIHEQNTPTVPISKEDAKQLQDLLGQMREDGQLANQLEDLDNKLHNLWLRPADHFPRP